MKKLTAVLAAFLFTFATSANAQMSMTEMQQGMIYLGVGKYATSSGTCQNNPEVFGKVVRVEGLLRVKGLDQMADLIVRAGQMIATDSSDELVAMSKKCDSMDSIGRFADTIATNLQAM